MSHEQPAIGLDAKSLHLVKCANCGATVGETIPVPGGLNRYKCKKCGQWTVLLVVEPAGGAERR